MSRKLAVLTALVCMLLAALFGLAALRPYSAVSQSMPGAEPSIIHFDGSRFVPQTLTVTVGTRVEWWNDTSQNHTLVAVGDPVSAANSIFLPFVVRGGSDTTAQSEDLSVLAEEAPLFQGAFPAGGVFAYTVAQPGQFSFSLAGTTFSGEVTVVDGPVPPTATAT